MLHLRGIHCDRARAWAALAPDGELSEFDQKLLDSHLDHCDACADFAVQVAAVAAGLRAASLEPLSHPISVPGWRRRSVYARARAVGAVAAVALMALGVASHAPLSPGEGDSVDLPHVTNFADNTPTREVELITRRTENKRASSTHFRPQHPGIVIQPI